MKTFDETRMGAEALAEAIGAFRFDPFGFTHFNYPWGEKGTALEHHSGPRAWQAQVMQDIGEHLSNPETRFDPLRISVASGHGIGKLHAYDTIVPTPEGMRRWGSLAVGDSVFGADGAAVSIRACTHYKAVPMYRVTFDDGSHCEVSSGHLWNVRGRAERRKGLDTWRTLETIEIVRLGVGRPNGKATARTWEIPIQGAAQFDHQPTALHPYLLGVWLGDGSVGRAAYTKPFSEIADRLEGLGYQVTRHSKGLHKIVGASHLFRGGVFDCLSHERFIPREYMINDIDSRMELFRGLCDTDGEVHASGSIGYSTTSRRLADDVVWLARSLGCKASVQATPKQGWYNDADGKRVDCRLCWRVTINAPFNPFTLKHRKEKYRPSEKRYLKRWISSIEPIPAADGMCITVEAEDGLYQANDFIVTHNSAGLSMIAHWALSTCVDTRIVVTANTEGQLDTKTSPEIAKWFKLGLNADWFKPTIRSIASTVAGHKENWRLDLSTWSKDNTEAFAGLHNEGKRIVLIFDEASGIDAKVWEVALGALTDANTEIIWLAFGNPTQGSGAFYETHHGQRHLWKRYQIDSRTVEGTNKKLLNLIASTYGEDHDITKVRVRGMFPSTSAMQFIGAGLIESAQERETPVVLTTEPLIFGLDCARFGDDSSVLAVRRGRDARSIPWKRWNQVDAMTLAAEVNAYARIHHPDAIMVDAGNIGAAVIDRLRVLNPDLPVFEVWFGGKGGLVEIERGVTMRTKNKRTTIWAKMRNWLRIGALPLPAPAGEPDQLRDDLGNPQYGYAGDEIELERKDAMKKRGVASPDEGDALACTFAEDVVTRRQTAAIAAAFEARSRDIGSRYDEL